MTRVEIDLFKPISSTYVLFVRTKDRGLAIQTVMSRFKPEALSCVNTIYARLDNPSPRDVVEGILEPIARVV